MTKLHILIIYPFLEKYVDDNYRQSFINKTVTAVLEIHGIEKLNKMSRNELYKVCADVTRVTLKCKMKTIQRDMAELFPSIFSKKTLEKEAKQLEEKTDFPKVSQAGIGLIIKYLILAAAAIIVLLVISAVFIAVIAVLNDPPPTFVEGNDSPTFSTNWRVWCLEEMHYLDSMVGTPTDYEACLEYFIYNKKVSIDRAKTDIINYLNTKEIHSSEDGKFECPAIYDVVISKASDYGQNHNMELFLNSFDDNDWDKYYDYEDDSKQEMWVESSSGRGKLLFPDYDSGGKPYYNNKKPNDKVGSWDYRY